jgi:Protein of unknown function (DUF3987)
MRKPPARGAPRVLSNSKRAGIEAVQDGYPVYANGASTEKSQQHQFSGNEDKFRDCIADVALHLLGPSNRKLCKMHELRWGERGSFMVDTKKGTWSDFETDEGGGTLDLVKRELKFATNAEAAQWLEDEGFIRSDRTNGTTKSRANGNDHGPTGELERKYYYTDAAGEVMFEVWRYMNPKDFRPYYDGRFRLPPREKLVVYRLPEVIQGVIDRKTIYICEGEKDVDTAVERFDLIATCNQGGTGGGWREQYNETFRGAEVVIIPDRDKDNAGLKHAEKIAAALSGVAERVRILKLWDSWKECPLKGDFTKWVEAGHTREQLIELADALPNYEPSGSEASVDEASITPIDLWGHLNPPELSRGLLPALIEQFAFEQGEVMGVDPGGLAVAALTVCAAAIPDSIELQVKKHDRGWTESARLWTALVGMPSTKKTPTLREAMRPLARIDAAYAREYATAKQVYDDLPSDERKQTTKPERKQLKLEDTSIEAAQEVVRYNSNGVLCLADELSGWFGSMDKYNSGRGAAKDRGFWLQAWNGGSYSVNRVTRSSYLIENLSVSVLGGIQPDLIRKAADESHDDGLIQRLLPIVVRPGTAGRDEPTHETVDAYADLIERLHRLEPTFAAGWDNPSGQATKLEFDYDAQAIRRQLAQKHLELMGLEVINKKLAAHIGKYDAFFARLCVVFHCVEHLSGPTQASMAVAQERPTQPQSGRLPRIITAATAERVAKFLHQFLLRHAAAFYAGILDLSDDHDRLAAVAGHILAHKLDRVTNRDVQRGDRTMRKLTRWDTERVFEQLEALGWVVRKPAPRPADPPHWQVNPEVHRLFADRAGQEATRRAAIRDLLTQLAR